MADEDDITETGVEDIAVALLGYEGHAAPDCTDDCLADATAFVREELVPIVKRLVFEGWTFGYTTAMGDTAKLDAKAEAARIAKEEG